MPPSVDEQLLQSASAPLRLRRAVDESARLLGASGAMVYLLDEAGEQLRWAYDAGIDTTGEHAWVRDIHFPVGVGLFGRIVRERSPQRTDDYLADARFSHAPSLDRFVNEFGARSVVVAPLIGVSGPLGAIGAFSPRNAAFDERDMAMLEVLALLAGRELGLVAASGWTRSKTGRPIDQDGLLVALRKHAAAVQGRTGLPVAVDCTCDIDDERLPAGIEESVYRIGQEALHTVVKHAKATEARIQISRERGRAAPGSDRQRARLRFWPRPERAPGGGGDADAGRPHRRHPRGRQRAGPRHRITVAVPDMRARAGEAGLAA